MNLYSNDISSYYASKYILSETVNNINTLLMIFDFFYISLTASNDRSFHKHYVIIRWLIGVSSNTEWT